MRALAALCLASLALAGCARRTEVVVVITSDIPWGRGAAMTGLLITVRSGDERGAIRDRRAFALGDGAGGTYALPATFGIVPLDGDANRTFWVEVMGCGGAGCDTSGTPTPLVTQRAIVGFVRGQTLALNVFLASDCLHVTCSETQTCARATCVDARVPATSLAPWDPSHVDAGNDLVQRDASDASDGGGDAGPTPSAPRVSSGGGHSCAIRAGGALWCWGSNDQGEIGLGDAVVTEHKLVPVQVPLASVARVALGPQATCAIQTGGALSCWGYNGEHQLGIGSPESPVRSPRAVLPSALDVSLGEQHGCAVDDSHHVQCWGGNFSGQVGDGTNTLRDHGPVVLPGIANVTHVTCGRFFSCALLAGGDVRCWGENLNGQIGDGTIGGSRNVPTVVTTDGTTPLTGVIDVQAGTAHACALLADRTVRCWGNGLGLGTGDTGNSVAHAVTPMGLPPGVVAITSGGYTTCALLPDTTVRCWGLNEFGEVGNGSDSPSGVPVRASTVGTSVAEISLARGHGCALRVTGTVDCWGLNDGGQLGNGTSSQFSATPLDVPGAAIGLAHLALGLEDLPAAATWNDSPGDVFAWGAQGYVWPVLGLAPTNTLRAVSALMPVSDLAMGIQFACAIYASDHTVHCWGVNADGQHGDGSTTATANVVTQVTGITDAQQLTAGDSHVCALHPAGAVSCWGANRHRQLGVGSTNAIEPSPLSVSVLPAGNTVAEVRASDGWTCVRTVTTGNVYCWGENTGDRLAATAQPTEASAVHIAGVTGATQLSMSRSHACAVVAGGAVACWGLNEWKQCGPSAMLTATAQMVPGLSNVAFVAAGNEFTCALAGAGHPQPRSVWCWGRNGHGQGGTGSVETVVLDTPTRVGSFTDAVTVAAGVQTACAVHNAGNPVCWGVVPGTGLGGGGGFGVFTPVMVTGLPAL